MKVTLYHNPRCSKSREALARLTEGGHDVEVVQYLKTPLDRAALRRLSDQLGQGVRAMMRTNETLYKELGLANADEDALLDAMAANPILMNRPIVVTEKGARLGRPPEVIDEVL